jgi:hypothetical protein
MIVTMARLECMASKTMVARPGPLLYGATIFGLLVWLGVLLLLPWVKGIGVGTYLSAVLMALLFATLLLGHLSTEIQFRSDGISAKTFFRTLRCRWAGVDRVEVRPLVPGITIYLICTVRGPVVFTSLWKNHRPLLEALRQRTRFA